MRYKEILKWPPLQGKNTVHRYLPQRALGCRVNHRVSFYLQRRGDSLCFRRHGIQTGHSRYIFFAHSLPSEQTFDAEGSPSTPEQHLGPSGKSRSWQNVYSTAQEEPHNHTRGKAVAQVSLRPGTRTGPILLTEENRPLKTTSRHSNYAKHAMYKPSEPFGLLFHMTRCPSCSIAIYVHVSTHDIQ